MPCPSHLADQRSRCQTPDARKPTIFQLLIVANCCVGVRRAYDFDFGGLNSLYDSAVRNTSPTHEDAFSVPQTNLRLVAGVGAFKVRRVHPCVGELYCHLGYNCYEMYSAQNKYAKTSYAYVRTPSIVCYHFFFSCCLPAWPVPDPASLQATQAGNS